MEEVGDLGIDLDAPFDKALHERRRQDFRHRLDRSAIIEHGANFFRLGNGGGTFGPHAGELRGRVPTAAGWRASHCSGQERGWEAGSGGNSAARSSATRTCSRNSSISGASQVRRVRVGDELRFLLDAEIGIGDGIGHGGRQARAAARRIRSRLTRDRSTR